MVLFPLLSGIMGGFLNSLYILFSSPHFFWNFLDTMAFVVASLLIYAVVGAFIGFFMALLPIGLFRIDGTDKLGIIAFYMSAFLIWLPASAFMLETIEFSTFNLQLLRNLFLVMGCFAVSMILTYLSYKIFKNSGLAALVYDKTQRFSGKVVLVSSAVGILVITSFNFVTDRFSDPKSFFPSDRPNIILISLDTLGARHLSAYGYSKKTSPNMDAMAKEGVLFERAFSPSKWTLPAHMSMLTSTYPSVHQVISPERVLDGSFFTMAEILKEYGYYCGAFVDKGEFGHVGAGHGFDDGFDFYEHYPERFDKYEKLFVVRHFFNFVEGTLLRLSFPIMHSQKIANRVLTWLKHYKREKPFFLFLHSYDIHAEGVTKLPYVSPPPYNSMHNPQYTGNYTGCGTSGLCASLRLREIAREYRRDRNVISDQDLEYIISLYDGGISYVDNHIGKLLEGLKELKLEQNTLVIVTSDHGEEFMQHGQFLHGQYYDEIVHVPLIMKLPGTLPENVRVKSVVGTIDILPTVLDLLNIEKIDQIQGASLLSSVKPENETESPMSYGGLDKTLVESIPISFVRTNQYKLIRKERESGTIRELYNFVDDPMESTNVIEHETDISKELEEYLLSWIEDCEFLKTSKSYSFDSEELILPAKIKRELKSLGYIR
jgi:arylsulfatase A-like enzyme